MPEIFVFSPQSDALMASLASRSHEWLQWQIVECEEIKVEATNRVNGEPAYRNTAFRQIFLTVNARVPDERSMGSGHVRLSEHDSPSEAVARALKLATSNFEPLKMLPGYEALDLQEGESAPDLPDPRQALDATLAQLKALEGSGSPSFVQASCCVIYRRTKNSRGHVSYETSLEIDAKERWRHRPLSSKVF